MNRNGRFPSLLLTSLTLLFGLQTLRVLFSLALYVLRDRFGWSAIQIGLLMAVFFALSFLAGLFRRWWGTEKMLLGTAVGVGLFRLLLQLWSGDPLVDLILAFLTIFCFMLFVPVALAFARSQGTAAVQDVALGLLLGGAFDVALHGAFRTYDMAWQSGWLTAAMTLTLVIMQGLTAWLVASNPSQETINKTDTTLRLGLSWLAVGPFLFLELLIFSNLARLTVLTGWGQAAAFFILLTAHLLSVLVLAWLFNRNGGAVHALFGGILGLLLLAALIMPWPTGLLAALQLLLGQLILALLMGTLVVALGAGNGRSGLRNLALGNGLGWLLMAIFVFLYYAGYDILLPFNNDWLFPLAALLIALCAFFAARTLPRPASAPEARLGWAILLSLLLLLLPLVQFLDQPATAVPGDGAPMRVMTYNLHNGFDMSGHLGLEALAQVIEAENPDVIGLQEVNRGWVVNGSTDMLTWLSQRLDMPYVWGATSDPLWGNALLSRLPLTGVDQQLLPPRTLLLSRGFIWAEVDAGNGNTLNILNTHFHHEADGSLERTMQAQAIMNYWWERPYTIIMGDLNAEPATPEIQIIQNRGFQSVLDLLRIQPGYTYDASHPSQRLDHILITPDILPANAAIPAEPASDHLPIVTDIMR